MAQEKGSCKPWKWAVGLLGKEYESLGYAVCDLAGRVGVLGGQVPLASPVSSPMVRDVARKGPKWSPVGYAIQNGSL